MKILGCQNVEGGLVVIEIALPKDRLELVENSPGQFVRICVPELDYFEWHPFSLINYNENIAVVVGDDMPVTTWTGKRKIRDSTEQQLSILIDGPFGGIDFDIQEMDSIICLGGGTGISPCVRVLQEVSVLPKCTHSLMLWSSKGFVDTEIISPGGLLSLLSPLTKSTE